MSRNMLFPLINNICRSYSVLPKANNYIVLHTRHSSYQSSKQVEHIEETGKFEVTKSPEEWKYVALSLAPVVVPVPQEKSEYSSGWRPQAGSLSIDAKYFIPRNKNFMVPIYLHTSHRGMKKITKIRSVQGDVFQLEKDIKLHIENTTGRSVATLANELVGYIHIKGDHVNLVKHYLIQKGF